MDAKKFLARSEKKTDGMHYGIIRPLGDFGRIKTLQDTSYSHAVSCDSRGDILIEGVVN